jgi:putative drug exporter of the RND superfamily
VSAPAGREWHRAGTALAVVLPRAETSTQAGQHVIDRVRQELRRHGPGAGAGGEGAQTLDFIRAVYGSFPLMIGLIACVTWVLLARAFRSLLLPLQAAWQEYRPAHRTG